MALTGVLVVQTVVFQVEPELGPDQVAASDPLAAVSDVEVQPGCGQVRQVQVTRSIDSCGERLPGLANASAGAQTGGAPHARRHYESRRWMSPEEHVGDGN